MKSNMSIEVEFLAGTSFLDACEEAHEKAIEWDVAYVKFDFNGVRVSVGQRAIVDDKALQLYYEKMDAENKYLILNGQSWSQ